MPELVKELTRDISELVRQEIELARLEMTEKGKKAGPASACSAARLCSVWRWLVARWRRSSSCSTWRCHCGSQPGYDRSVCRAAGGWRCVVATS